MSRISSAVLLLSPRKQVGGAFSRSTREPAAEDRVVLRSSCDLSKHDKTQVVSDALKCRRRGFVNVEADEQRIPAFIHPPTIAFDEVDEFLKVGVHSKGLG